MAPVQTTTFRNRIASFYWIFALFWLGMLGLAIYLMIRDGPPDEHSAEFMWGILALFCLGGAGLAGYTLSHACFGVTVSPEMTTFTWQYPHKRVRKSFPTAELSGPRLVEGRDSDGDPYFRATLDLPDGSSFDLAEGHDRETVEDTIRRFESAARIAHGR